MGSAQNFLSFLISFVVFFIFQPSLQACGCLYLRFLPTGRASACKRGSSSGRSSTSCRSSRSWLSLSWSHLLEWFVATGVTGRRYLSGVSEEGLPRPLPLFLRTGRTGSRCRPCLNLLCGFCSSWSLLPFVKPIIDIFRFKVIGACLNLG